jgi:hypothetical protein
MTTVDENFELMRRKLDSVEATLDRYQATIPDYHLEDSDVIQAWHAWKACKKAWRMPFRGRRVHGMPRQPPDYDLGND